MRIAPGAAVGPSKCWPAERYAAVADALHEECGARCVLLTGPGEEATRDAVRAAARTPLLNPYAGPGSIAELKAVIASLDLLIGNDSGPRHIAIAFKKPVICVMGPTSPAYTASPWERGRVLRVHQPAKTGRSARRHDQGASTRALDDRVRQIAPVLCQSWILG